MFIDEAIVRVRGGRGGSGVIHFHSTRHNPRGGADGGSGGSGGSVYFEASGSISTLFAFRNRPLFAANDGESGGNNTRAGAGGVDRTVHVPIGTLVRDATTRELLGDLSRDGDRLLVAEGGEGGRGNSRFVTSRRQGPRLCERGLPGEERRLRLELKLIADIGIIGYPNVGKSSLLSSISAKKAKVADYPFTTIVPNLGVVSVDETAQFVAVDVPGLIEGAHEGRGLGDRFLRHIERTRGFVHVVDLARLDGRDPLEDIERINAELTAFNPDLAERPQITAGNKIDLLDDGAIEDAVRRFATAGITLYPISVATGNGIPALVSATYRMLSTRVRRSDPTHAETRRIYRHSPDENEFRVEREDDMFVIIGCGIEKLVAKLILETRDALPYLTERLEKMGVLTALRRQGFEPGDVVRIGKVELELDE
ncbi:GTPase ObgE [Candidatus Bipolaricaulota bacterium]|nr:GTPase ObgE [Candidatus Bipolaricaulota bacterium]